MSERLMVVFLCSSKRWLLMSNVVEVWLVVMGGVVMFDRFVVNDPNDLLGLLLNDFASLDVNKQHEQHAIATEFACIEQHRAGIKVS